MKEFLLRCPSCGTRFVVRVTSKKLIDSEQDMERVVHNIVAGLPSRGSAPIVATTVEEVPIERETFDVSYECKRCHHLWTEPLTVTKKA